MIIVPIFIIGLAFGSFLNVVVYRLNPALQLKGWVFGRSMCLNCRSVLKWYDLIPVLNFVWLKGRCRYCGKKISWQYPLVEILSGLIWLGVFYKVFGSLGFAVPAEALAQAGDFAYHIFIFSALLVIAVYDFKWKIIPDKIVYPAIIVALIFNLFEIINPPFIPPLIKGGLGGFFTALAAFLFFFLIFYFSKGKAMGLGDAKLAFLIGLFLKPILALVAFNIAFIIGALCGIILIILKKKSLKSQIAFGPFLAFGATAAFILSDFIIKFFQP